MKTASKLLRRIDALPEPRHIFILPEWTSSNELDRLLKAGYLASDHVRRDPRGRIKRVMNLQLTLRGLNIAFPEEGWTSLAMKGSMAGACLTAMSLLILYLG